MFSKLEGSFPSLNGSATNRSLHACIHNKNEADIISTSTAVVKERNGNGNGDGNGNGNGFICCVVSCRVVVVRPASWHISERRNDDPATTFVSRRGTKNEDRNNL